MARGRGSARGFSMDRAAARVLLLCLAVTCGISLLYLINSAAGDGFAWRSVPLDDVWIHQVYARSIAEGQPFAYNPGEQETGSTSPLWAFLLAPAHVVGIPPVAFTKILCIVLTALAAWAGWRIARAMGESRAGMLFAVALPLMPYFAFAAVSGTEVPLFVFLSLLAVEMLLRGRPRAGGLVTGLAILSRPEGFLLLGAGALSIAVARPRERDRLAGAVAFLLVAGAVVAPWVLYCVVATGRPLPATFYAKAHWFGPLDFAQIGKIGALLADQSFIGSTIGRAVAIPQIVIGLAMIVLGTVRCVRGGRTTLILVGLSGWLFLYALSMTTPLGERWPADLPGSVRNFYFARYLLPGFAPLLLVFVLGVEELRRRVSGRAGRVAVVAILLLLVASSLAGHGRMRSVYSWNCRNIEELQVVAARWVATNIPEEASVGVSDAGAMRYFGRHRIFDLVGLNSHRLLPLMREIDRAPAGGPEEARLREQFWRTAAPDYLAITSGWHVPLLRKRAFVQIGGFRIDRNTICGGDEVLVLRPESAASMNPP